MSLSRCNQVDLRLRPVVVAGHVCYTTASPTAVSLIRRFEVEMAVNELIRSTILSQQVTSPILSHRNELGIAATLALPWVSHLIRGCYSIVCSHLSWSAFRVLNHSHL